MPKPYSASMPDNLDLPFGWQIRFSALDAATGTPVAGVTVSGASLIVTNVHGGDLSAPGFEVVEATWLNLPVTDPGGP